MYKLLLISHTIDCYFETVQLQLNKLKSLFVKKKKNLKVYEHLHLDALQFRHNLIDVDLKKKKNVSLIFICFLFCETDIDQNVVNRD